MKHPLTIRKTAYRTFDAVEDPGEPDALRKDGKRHGVTETECALLRLLAADKAVCEIGTGLGISTAAMLQTARVVTTCDIDPWVEREIVPWLLTVALGHDTEFAFVPGRPDGGQTYDMFFIDGNHRYEHVKADLDWCYQHAHGGSIYVLHDMGQPDVERAANEFVAEHLELDGVLLHSETIMGMVFRRALVEAA